MHVPDNLMISLQDLTILESVAGKWVSKCMMSCIVAGIRSP
jgi:hypothetical protein